MNTARTFIKNWLANYGRTIYQAVIGVVTIGIIARYLSPDSFGQYVYIIAFMTISEVTASMGVPIIICREIAKEKTGTPTLLASGLILQSILSIITVAIIGLIFYLIAPYKELFYAALTCGVAQIFKFLGRLFWSIYLAYERMAFGTLQTFITQSLYLIFLIVAINRDLGLYGIFTALLLAHLAEIIFGYVLITKIFVRPEFNNVRGLCKFLLRESIPLAVKGGFRKLNVRAGILLLATMKSNFEVGIFGGPHKIMLNLIFIGESSSQVMLPIFSRMTATSQSSLSVAYEKSSKLVLLIGLPLAIFLSTFSEQLIVLILGHKYIESALVLAIIGWTLVPLFFTSLLEKMLIAGNKQGLTTVAMAITLGVTVLLNLLLIPKMGYIGVSIATLVAETVTLCLDFYFVWRYLGHLMRMSAVVRPLVAGLATYGILSLFSDINLFLGGLLELVIYIMILFILKTFTEEEISFFKQLLRVT